jgi:hypothetical protein
MELSNVDDRLLHQDEPALEISPSIEEPPIISSESLPEEAAQDDSATDDESPETTEEEQGSQPETDKELDEYGTEIESEKEEMIPKSVMRERLERKNRETEQRIAEAQEQIRQEILREFQANQKTPPNTPVEGSDDWEAQLKDFIVKTNQDVAKQEAEKKWRQQEAETQAQFEVKFNTGAAKYKDFETVVMGKAITPQMVIATRGMNDPAAFVYAAAKTQPQELDRISKITDPYAQVIELGRLEERLKKARNHSSTAPKPASNVTGDVAERVQGRTNIDDKILADQKRRMRR